jgi:hypothetical protein
MRHFTHPVGICRPRMELRHYGLVVPCEYWDDDAPVLCGFFHHPSASIIISWAATCPQADSMALPCDCPSRWRGDHLVRGHQLRDERASTGMASRHRFDIPLFRLAGPRPGHLETPPPEDRGAGRRHSPLTPLLPTNRRTATWQTRRVADGILRYRTSHGARSRSAALGASGTT